MAGLFRQSAVEHATRRLNGSVVLAAPITTYTLSMTVLAILAIGITFVATATYSRKETVVGWITPEQGVSRISALRGGVLEELYISEGDQVEPGQLIARVRISAELASGDAGETILQTLYAQTEAAARTAEAEFARLDAERTRLSGLVDGLNAELVQIDQQISYQEDLVNLTEADVDNTTEIAERGYVSNREVSARRQTDLTARQQLARLQGTAASLRRQRDDVQAQLAIIPISIESARANAEAARASLAERVVSSEVQNAYVVSSDINASVAAIPARGGQTLGPGDTVAVLVPSEDQLVAEILIPSRAAGFVREGQELRLLYDAFPHQRFGSGSGTVDHISTTVLAPVEVSIPGVVVNEPVFRARARISRQQIEAYGEVIPLQPGMLLTADIIVDRRTLIEWLFDPLFAAGRR